MNPLKLILPGKSFAWLLAASLAAATPAGPESSRDIFSALRNGDTAAVRVLAGQKAVINAPNAAGETPLMFAALFSGAETVALLLDQGANPNARTPAGTTALMLATGDLEKVRLLVDRGADANARSVTGRTPLLIAASRAGAGPVVKFLLAHGADPNAKDGLQGMPLLPAGAGGSTPLIEAAKMPDPQTLKYLLDAGAKVSTKDNSGADALAAAALNGNLENVGLLLQHGARPDASVSTNQYSPLILAAWRQNAKLVKLLLAAGANPNAQDAGGSTALMWSAFSDYAEPETTRLLLDAGAQVNVRNRAGDTAMTWARKRGETPIVKLLLARGASAETAAVPPVRLAFARAEGASIKRSIQRSVALLQKTGPQFFAVSGCVSCHNQSIPQMLTAAARKRGIPVDENLVEQTRKQVLGILKPAKLPLLEMSDVVPDIPGTAPYVLLGLAAEGYHGDEVTDPVVLNLAAKQFPDGSWRPWAPRPPLEFSAVTSTALAVRTLRELGPPAARAEFDKRIAAAQKWLRAVKPRTTEEKSMRLLGLQSSGASKADVAEAVEALVAAQREDGGWSQLDTLGSDAYATGQALYVLRTAGGLSSSNPVYLRGAAYLLSTQLEDGSWHVTSRAFPFQPYKESGFPHGRDQWISATGTGWAALALTLAGETPSLARR